MMPQPAEMRAQTSLRLVSSRARGRPVGGFAGGLVARGWGLGFGNGNMGVDLRCQVSGVREDVGCWMLDRWPRKVAVGTKKGEHLIARLCGAVRNSLGIP